MICTKDFFTYPCVYDDPCEYGPKTYHECIADAVFDIMQELYDSYSTINEHRIKDSFAYLCDKLGIDKSLIHNDLCITHKQPTHTHTL